MTREMNARQPWLSFLFMHFCFVLAPRRRGARSSCAHLLFYWCTHSYSLLLRRLTFRLMYCRWGVCTDGPSIYNPELLTFDTRTHMNIFPHFWHMTFNFWRSRTPLFTQHVTIYTQQNGIRANASLCFTAQRISVFVNYRIVPVVSRLGIFVLLCTNKSRKHWKYFQNWL